MTPNEKFLSANNDLFKKYDVPAPRYTSYPTVPYWSTSPTPDQWISELKAGLASEGTKVSVYVHIPYCETLCTFCGCNTTITKDHKRESPYVDRLLKELDIYLKQVPELSQRETVCIHLGGGTPTFLSEFELARLVKGLKERLRIDERGDFEGSVEVDPRRTTKEQLAALRQHGFNRVSLGVQDFDPEVQRLVNRIQPFEQTETITKSARDLGYSSVNFDLIYGLPRQTLETTRVMIQKTIELRPDRIALYSFALVPWIKPAQRLFRDEDLPSGAAKRELYELARAELLKAGYLEIGMDHFALPTDGLARAGKAKLHRNFMGYSDQRTDVLLGLGVSAISEAPGCFHQNEKVLPVWEEAVDAGRVPGFRGHVLTSEDRKRREQILRLMTRYEVELESDEQVDDVKAFLREMIGDGLVEINGRNLRVLDGGKPFLRNACLALDARLRLKSPETRIFSMSV